MTEMLRTRLGRMCVLLALLAGALICLRFSSCRSRHTIVELPRGESAAVPSAHRAGALEVRLPDNSEAALRSALTARLPLIEVDVRVTLDGVPYLHHDRRLSSHAYKIPAPLKRLRFEAIMAADIADMCSRSMSSECLLSLERALQLVVSSVSKPQLQIDVKGEGISKVLALVRDTGAAEQVIMFCDPISELEEVRTTSPSLPTIARLYGREELYRIVLLQPSAVQIELELLKTPLYEALRARGIGVLVKTLGHYDTVATWQQALDGGAKIVLTDRPRQFVEFQARARMAQEAAPKTSP